LQGAILKTHVGLCLLFFIFTRVKSASSPTALFLASSGGTCSWRGVADNHYHGSDSGNGKGSGMDKKLADLANVQRKEMREDQDNADKRGGQSPVRHSGNLDCGVMRGQ
jgi:hypothetical protein